jgi:GntR family transcriptional regulator
METSQKQRTTEQVADALIERIADEQWGKSSPLPALDVLTKELNASEATIAAALEQLLDEKLISRRSGGAYTVTDVQARALSVRFSNLVRSDGSRVTGEVLRAKMEQATATETEAERLGIEAGDPVCRIHRLRGHAGGPFMVEVSTLPLAMFPGLLDDDRVPFRTPVLCRRYGITVRQAEEHVSLGIASADIAVALGVSYGTPLFVLERVLFAADGRALEFRIGQTLMTNLRYVATWSAGDR